MHKRTKSIIAVALLIATTVTTASCNIYYLHAYSGGNLIWNASEAYVFMQVGRRGHHISYIRYPLFAVKEILGGIEPADDDRASLVVIRVTSLGVERHVLKLADRSNGGAGSDPLYYTPVEGRIFVQCPPLDLCKWSDDHFEPATKEERQRLDGIKSLTRDDFEKNANGWSRRGFGAGTPSSKFEIKVGDKFALAVNNLAKDGTDNANVTIDLLRQGKPPERIGDFYRRQGKVTRTEYLQAFSNPE